MTRVRCSRTLVVLAAAAAAAAANIGLLAPLSLPCLAFTTPPAQLSRGLELRPDQGRSNREQRPQHVPLDHLMRAGTSFMEEQHVVTTNPLFLTNRDHALSSAGEAQVLKSCEQLSTNIPTVVKYSMAAATMESAHVVQGTLGIGRDRVVPEFTFLDPRGLGAWDRQDVRVFGPAIMARDHDDGHPMGTAGAPPETNDGTPHETLADQAVRLRQIMSILETQYSRDTIMLLFPDGTGPALLSCMMAGIAYNRCHVLEFAPGEVRLNVTPQTIKQLYESRRHGSYYDAYMAQVEQGRRTLQTLQHQPLGTNLPDAALEREMARIDQKQKTSEAKRRQETLDRARQASPAAATEINVNPSVLAAAGSVVALARAGAGVQQQQQQRRHVLVENTASATHTAWNDPMVSAVHCQQQQLQRYRDL